MILAALAVSAAFALDFESASKEYDVPVVILEAIAFAETRFQHRIPEPLDGHSVPPSYGIMGLRDDPHFGSSLRLAAALIGHTPEELQQRPDLNIRGAAALLHHFSGGATRATPLEQWKDAVALYSGIPQPDIAEIYTYGVFAVTDADLQQMYGDKLRVLAAPRISVVDYGLAIWNPATECNYRAGRTESVTHIAEHIMEGVYAGTISWFKNCASSVSAHYLVRSFDGQITQMVRETDTAFHVASHNTYTIGIEHEGFVTDCAWYSMPLYIASATLTRDIADRYSIPRHSTYDASLAWDTELPRDSPWRIKGHTNFPTAKTCPGQCFDWLRYRTLVIAAPPPPKRRAAGQRQ